MEADLFPLALFYISENDKALKIVKQAILGFPGESLLTKEDSQIE